jgi:hypothetical protein
MRRPKAPAAKPLRMLVEIELAPLGESEVYEDSAGQVLIPVRVVVDGKPIHPSRSQTDWLLVKTHDWYLHLAWGAREKKPKGKM